MVKIDENTGLPELPEGHFWSVRRDGVSIRKSIPDTDWVELSAHRGRGAKIPENYQGKMESMYRKKTRTVTRGWMRKEVQEEYMILEGRYVSVSREVASQLSEEAPIVKADIIPLCEKAMEKLEAEKFYGEYPPKKFESDKE